MRLLATIISFLLISVLCVAFAAAENETGNETAAPALSMTINADSHGGDIVIEANPNSGNGTTTYMLNDEKLLDRMETMDGRIKSGSEMDGYISSFILGLFVREFNFPGKKGWTEVDESKLTQEQGQLRSFLNYYFVPRSELYDMLEDQEDKIVQLQLEIRTLQKMHTDEELCQARLLVAVEEGIDKVTCGDTTYRWNENKQQFIGITSK